MNDVCDPLPRKSILTEAVHRHKDLSDSLLRALDRSDNIVILVEYRHRLLSILAVNDQAQLTTEYLGADLIGRPITLLTGPDTDAAGLGNLLAAARDGHAHRTQLLCRSRSGRKY